MTFKEFFNQRDNSPLKLSLRPADGLTGMAVAQDYSKVDLPDPVTKPAPPAPVRPPNPAMLMGRSRLGDRPVEKKPSHFLPRRQSTPSPLSNNK